MNRASNSGSIFRAIRWWTTRSRKSAANISRFVGLLTTKGYGTPRTVGTVVEVLPQTDSLGFPVDLELHGVYRAPLALATLIVGVNDLPQFDATHLLYSE